MMNQKDRLTLAIRLTKLRTTLLHHQLITNIKDTIEKLKSNMEKQGDEGKGGKMDIKGLE